MLRAIPNISFEQTSDVWIQFQRQTLPVLKNLAAQVISALAQSFTTYGAICEDLGTNEAVIYRKCKSLFDQTRQIYSADSLFIEDTATHFSLPHELEIIGLANRATFISEILIEGECSLFELHEYFWEAAVAFRGPWHKSLSRIFIELKTQVLISTLLNSDTNQQEVLDHLFPTDRADYPGGNPIKCSDVGGFISACFDRRQELINVMIMPAGVNEILLERYPWQMLTDAVIGYLRTAAVPELHAILHPDPVSTDQNAHQRVETAAESSETPTPPSGRRLWTPEQENVLLEALAEVGGPHWARILALHGKEGSKSHILESKSQVQIKDKARNLKLSYLRAGLELPDCLQAVTGELPWRKDESRVLRRSSARSSGRSARERS